MATAVAKLGVTLKFQGQSDVIIHEGDVITNMTYGTGNNVKTISGSVRVINASTKVNGGQPIDCPPEGYVHKYITVQSLVIDSSEEFNAVLTRIPVEQIKSIESIHPDGASAILTSADDLTEAINNLEPGSTIQLMAGTYNTPVTVSKSVVLEPYGNGDVVLTQPLTFAPAGVVKSAEGEKDPVFVTLKNLTLTGAATISVSNIDAFTMTSCTCSFDVTEKTMPIHFKTPNEMLLTVTDCVFNKSGAGSYNLFECYAKLKNGSQISNNTFNSECCTHNQISLYNIDNDASIDISDNVCEKSANMVRIGFKGDPNGTVVLNNNTYHTTDTAPYSGLLIVQPYGTETTNMHNLHITIDGTDNKTEDPQIFYLYSGANDMKFTADVAPIVTLDGQIVPFENMTIEDMTVLG